jgi:small subunit ribosomal protein S18
MEECYFCKQNSRDIDFKNIKLLKRFVTGLGKIRSRKTSGLCLLHQRKVANAIKKARNLGLLSATSKS